MADDLDADRTLTLEAKEAIRSYVLRLATLPAIGVSLLSFAVGFGVSDWARSTAYLEAYIKANELVLKSTSEAASAAVRADLAREKAEGLAARVESVSEKARKSSAEVEVAIQRMQQANDIVQEKFNEIVAALMKHPEFKNTIAEANDTRFKAVDAGIAALRTTLAADVLGAIEFVVEPPTPSTGAHVMESKCPQGYVAVAPVCTLQGLTSGPNSNRLEASLAVGNDGIHRAYCKGGVSWGGGYTSTQAICARQKLKVGK